MRDTRGVQHRRYEKEGGILRHRSFLFCVLLEPIDYAWHFMLNDLLIEVKRFALRASEDLCSRVLNEQPDITGDVSECGKPADGPRASSRQHMLPLPMPSMAVSTQ